MATALLEAHGNELEHIAVVLPGRRAGMVLRRYLAEALDKPFWSPDLLDMGAFMQRLTGKRQAGSLELLFLLHKLHQQREGDRADDLSEFLQWAPTTLRDMSEVDNHLLDLELLYRDLRNYHEIDNWSFLLDPLSAGQERLRGQWRATGELHRALQDHMAQLGIGTSGSLAREAAELALKDQLQVPWKAVWFAGLNALEPAYLAVVDRLQKRGLAKVAWDADKHYLDDLQQEAGAYLRRSIDTLGQGVLAPVNSIREKDRDLHVVSVPAPVAQARYAAQYLAELAPEERSDTVVVLADEELLPTLLTALPPQIDAINVTMGLPLRTLPVNGLVEHWLHLQEALGTSSGSTLPLDRVEALLLHPFLHQGSATSGTIGTLRESGDPRPRLATVMKAATDAGMRHTEQLKRLLSPLPEIAELPRQLSELLSVALSLRGNDPFAKEQLYRLAQLHSRLARELEQAAVPLPDLRSYAELRKRLLREERIDLYGEPLQGLQVMGLLETRAIDHARVLVLGASEGHLPRANESSSWIPFDLRRHYKLPLPSDMASIGAYHFNRLAQFASDLHLIHPATTADGAGEPSRFIAQWRHEVLGKSATRWHDRVYTAAYPSRETPVVEVHKTPAVLARVQQLLERGISPSALGTWLRCPLDLYFTQVLRLRAPDEVDGKLGSDVLGEAVHRVVEDVHAESIGKPLTTELLLRHADLAEAALTRVLLEKFPAETLAVGHFRLRIELASRAVANYLRAEAERCSAESTTPIANELDLKAELQPGVLVRGRCDRIEVREGLHHVLDLKTGKVDAKDLVLASLKRDELRPEHRYALQLLVYAYAYLANNPEVQRVRAGIIPLQRASASKGLFLKVDGSDELHRDRLPAMAALLMSLVDEIRDPAEPFRHDPESTWCACCIGA